MQTFWLHPLASAVKLAVVLMALVGILLILPIASIVLTWNSIIAHFTILPPISLWQACLLYIAFSCVFYLLGLVEIEIATEKLD